MLFLNILAQDLYIVSLQKFSLRKVRLALWGIYWLLETYDLYLHISSTSLFFRMWYLKLEFNCLEFLCQILLRLEIIPLWALIFYLGELIFLEAWWIITDYLRRFLYSAFVVMNFTGESFWWFLYLILSSYSYLRLHACLISLSTFEARGRSSRSPSVFVTRWCLDFCDKLSSA